MSQNRCMQRSSFALGVALVLATNTALADTWAPQLSDSETTVQLPVTDSTETMPAPLGSTTPRIYPSSETGVGRAAAQGPAALRHYIFRTRMIYNFYFWDFVNKE